MLEAVCMCVGGSSRFRLPGENFAKVLLMWK